MFVVSYFSKLKKCFKKWALPKLDFKRSKWFFKVSIVLFWKPTFPKKTKNFENEPSAKLLQPDENLIFTVIWCSYWAEIKLQYMKNTLHVAHFHINIVLSTRNMFKEAHVIKSRGALGTGFPRAPVLLFELYLAMNHSSTSHSPLGIRLLYELLFFPDISFGE